jgi:signal-transduction protein with cAMP-binding, CBS, and nucleotidyltransferase domain
MQPATVSHQSVDLHETVRSILAQKDQSVWSTSPDGSVFDAIALMSDKHVGALVVLTGGQLIGIITERDYARKVILQGRQSRDTKVREIMSTPALFVTPRQTIEECMHLMTSRQIRYLPVMDAGQVTGIVSIGDLVGWIIKAQDQTIRQLHNYISGSYPS